VLKCKDSVQLAS